MVNSKVKIEFLILESIISFLFGFLEENGLCEFGLDVIVVGKVGVLLLVGG